MKWQEHRNGTFEPKAVPKRQTTLRRGSDDRIISMYSCVSSKSVIPSSMYNRPFIKNLKKVYQVKPKESAEYNLEELDEKWGAKYPVVIQFQRNNL